MLKYYVLIGCSLHPKSDIMQDDVTWPITLSCVAASVWKQSFFSKLDNFLSNSQEIIEEIEQNILLTTVTKHKTTAAKAVSSLLFISYN